MQRNILNKLLDSTMLCCCLRHSTEIRDVSLVWYMYGGKDFESSPLSRTTTRTQRAIDMRR